MRAIIPAAGIGKRLRPHTLNVPKVMINIAGKRLIGHVLDAVESAGASSVSIIVGYKGEQVEEYVNRYYGHLRLDYPFQKERKGLGHAVLQGLEDSDESVLILLGDTVFDVDFSEFVSGEDNAIAVVKVDDPRRFGVAEIDAAHRIERLVEKPEQPKSDLALAGMYFIKDQRVLKKALEQLIADDVRTRGEYQLTDALQMMIADGETIKAIQINGWYDCGTKESLLDSHRFLLDGSQSTDHVKDTIVHQPVFIHPEARVSNSVIGPNVTIDKDSEVEGTIISESIIGKNSIIRNMILKNSLIGDNALAESHVRSINVGDYSELKFD
jgi:glucose-1-phosphate thymidylyltransferase